MDNKHMCSQPYDKQFEESLVTHIDV